LLHQLLAFAIERGVGQVLQQPVGFAIQNTVTRSLILRRIA
jgi:hypothetical protein